MNTTEFLNRENMKKILILCFCVILMFVAFEKIEGIFSIIGKFIDLIFPFILGGCIAFVFNVPLKKIEGTLFKNKPDFKGKRAISYILSLLIVIAVLGLATFVIVPELIETTKQLTDQVPAIIKQAQAFITEFTEKNPEIEKLTKDINFDYEELYKKVITVLTGVTGVLSSTVDFVGGIVSGFATFFIGFAFSIYILFRKEDLIRQFKKIFYAVFPEKVVERIIYICELSNRTFSNFITGQCLEACILGFMFFLTMSIFGMPYTVLISVLISLTALIPIFGAFIGCAVGALLILTQSPKQALIFIIMFLVLQQIEGNLIYPHVVGGSVGLPSIWVLVAITIGGDLMGIAGMLVFIPLCSVLYSLFRDFINGKIDKRGIPKEKYETKKLVPKTETAERET